MDSISSHRMMQPVVRKAKKKQVKDELDRLKQAEKKKRRLEKALATSAAICSELEKKKQKKKEEQQRLDEEGAAIAEAVALRVLLGEEEDSDDCCKIDFNFNSWDCANKVDLVDEIGWVSEGCGSGCDWGNGDWSCFSAGSYGVLAAQAVSALHIADDNGVLRG